MANYPFIYCNRNGIPCIESQSVNLTSTACTFAFKNHPFVNSYFQGLVAVKISQTFTAPSTAVPIQLTTIDNQSATNIVTTYAGANVTTSTWPGTGIYLMFFDRASGTLQMIGAL